MTAATIIKTRVVIAVVAAIALDAAISFEHEREVRVG
jgi:hypothetical protein